VPEVIVNAVHAIVMVKGAEFVFPPASTTRIVTVAVAAVLGVPLMTPAPFMLRPVGSVPEVMLHV
jgi:hypothetical protein